MVGIMNEFTFLVTAHRTDNGGPDLLDLSLQLATAPCSPLYRTNISPNRELAATIRFITT